MPEATITRDFIGGVTWVTIRRSDVQAREHPSHADAGRADLGHAVAPLVAIAQLAPEPD